MADLQLLTPTTLGSLELRNRVLMAPLTRNRAAAGRVPGDLQVEYYRQRAGAGLILTEATIVTPEGAGYVDTPGIYSDDQVAGWRRVTDAVHDEGGTIVCQLWHVGRVSHSFFHDGEPPVSSTDRATDTKVFFDGHFEQASPPRRLGTDEVERVVADFVRAAERAREAGFDGVEVHAANGYLLEQFLASDVNDRTDAYGGSLEGRARFPLDVIRAVADAWEPGRVGVRFSLGNGTAGATDDDPEAMLSYLGAQLAPLGLAYVHLVERFGARNGDAEIEADPRTAALRATGVAPVLVNGGYDRATGEAALEDDRAAAVVYGKPYIANPDLVERFRLDADLNEWDDATFYGGGAEGYVDYPTLPRTA